MSDLPVWELHLKEVTKKAQEFHAGCGWSEHNSVVTATAEVLRGTSLEYQAHISRLVLKHFNKVPH